MKIIDQSYEILSIPDNPLSLMEIAGRNCWKSEDKIGCSTYNTDCHRYDVEEPCDFTMCREHSSHKFVKMLRDKKHDAMLEFGDIAVRLITNRGVLAEITRHRIGISFSVESTRYVRYDGGMEFIRPVWCKSSCEDFNSGKVLPDDEDQWLMAMEIAEAKYQDLLKGGWRPEQAREVLPNSLKTEIILKANYREFRHLLKLRCSKKAHPQIRNLLLPLLKELKEKIPVIFDDIYPEE
jgi:thymidylate synthase (FAD)